MYDDSFWHRGQKVFIFMWILKIPKYFFINNGDKKKHFNGCLEMRWKIGVSLDERFKGLKRLKLGDVFAIKIKFDWE